jgi:hypothetical protein
MQQQPLSVCLTSEHQDLVQVGRYTYQTDTGTGARRTAAHGFTRTTRLYMPLMCTPAAWKRHEYSLSDVVNSLDFLPSINLWQLAVMLGIPLSNSSVKVAFATAESVVYSAKATVLRDIAAHLRQFYTWPAHSVLDRAHDQHVPPLPVHHVHMDMYARLKAVAPEALSAWDFWEENAVAEVFRWKDIWVMPLRREADHLYAVRVFKQPVYTHSERPMDSLATRPMQLRDAAGTLWFAACDEAVYFLPNYTAYASEKVHHALPKGKGPHKR